MGVKEDFTIGLMLFEKHEFLPTVPFELEDHPFYCAVDTKISTDVSDPSDAVAITSVKHHKTGVQLYGYLMSGPDYKRRPTIYSAYINHRRSGLEGDCFSEEIA